MNISTPLNKDVIETLNAGDTVSITGSILTGRDAAHKRIYDTLKSGESLPFDFKGQIIYYVGPCPAKPGQIINSCGPTTSSRMDAFTPLLLQHGLAGMIGKGLRDESVIKSMKKYKAVYFGAIGGAAALIADCVKKVEILAYEDLGTEAVRRLYVENFPVTVVIDSKGNNLYEIGRKKYKKII